MVSSVAFQIPALRMAIKIDLLKEIDNACTKLCKKKASSVLRAHRFQHMADFSWSGIIEEMSACCGDLLDVLATVTKGSRAAVIGMTYGMLMQARNHEMSICQRVNTVLLMDGGAKKQVNVFIFCNIIGVNNWFAVWHTLDLLFRTVSRKCTSCSKPIKICVFYRQFLFTRPFQTQFV